MSTDNANLDPNSQDPSAVAGGADDLSAALGEGELTVEKASVERAA